jgi:hypothetical protein
MSKPSSKNVKKISQLLPNSAKIKDGVLQYVKSIIIEARIR